MSLNVAHSFRTCLLVKKLVDDTKFELALGRCMAMNAYVQSNHKIEVVK